ncbi:hypothetical protein M758_11G123200 [Ceratodon purpureus]|nr:hypothetical protein M758_11G123200 [Ceratodon purpureus]
MLGFRTWLKQSPVICPYTDSTSGKNPTINSCWTKFLRQSRLFYGAALMIGFMLVLSTMFVNEHNFKDAFVNKLSGSLKDNVKEPCFLTKTHCSRGGAEALPRGIIVETSDLQFRSLSYEEESEVAESMPKNLLAMAVGIKQKKDVDEIVQKFPLTNYTIMLFHYDGVVDQWQDLPWSNQSIHIVGLHQTKWWFAKRFMHPDIIAQYNYVFLWDEDLGVEHFHADKYLEVMEAEGLEISQPALDPASADIHHALTRRQSSGRAHKMILRNRGSTICTRESNGPPCTGYVEVMAPVFSRAAWRCVWYMIQNDLVHGWGIDFKIGYCAQGVRSEKVGIIDAEYILHKGIPSLGGPRLNKTLEQEDVEKTFVKGKKHSPGKQSDLRREVRKRSGSEMLAFLRRWKTAAKRDHTWKDPYKVLNDSSGNYHRVR